jgi:hypothetical protein
MISRLMISRLMILRLMILCGAAFAVAATALLQFGALAQSGKMYRLCGGPQYHL